MKRLFCAFAAWGLLMGLTGPAKAQYMFTPIDFPGATRNFALGINNAGQIVGQYGDGGPRHGFLRDVDGSYTTIDVPGSPYTEANGINDAGQIVGYYFVDATGGHVFLLDVDGSYTTLDVPGAIRSTSAGGINDAGQIVGNYRDADAAGTYHGFVATSGG